MISTATRTERTAPQQLTLLADSDTTTAELAESTAPAQFRLSTATRRRGLAHVAQIRRQLADAQARREAELAQPLPPRHPQAA